MQDTVLKVSINSAYKLNSAPLHFLLAEYSSICLGLPVYCSLAAKLNSAPLHFPLAEYSSICLGLPVYCSLATKLNSAPLHFPLAEYSSICLGLPVYCSLASKLNSAPLHFPLAERPIQLQSVRQKQINFLLAHRLQLCTARLLLTLYSKIQYLTIVYHIDYNN